MIEAKDYKVVVYKFETSDGFSWCAEFPDFGGVAGGGDTPEEAMKDAYENLEVMISYYLENNLNLPKISKDEENEYSGRITLRMSNSLHAKIAKIAKKENVSLNSYICEAVSFYSGTYQTIEIANKMRDRTNKMSSESQIIISSKDDLNWYNNDSYKPFMNKGFASWGDWYEQRKGIR